MGVRGADGQDTVTLNESLTLLTLLMVLFIWTIMVALTTYALMLMGAARRTKKQAANRTPEGYIELSPEMVKEMMSGMPQRKGPGAKPTEGLAEFPPQAGLYL